MRLYKHIMLCWIKAHITFHLLTEIVEIWINISFMTVNSRERRCGWLHNQRPLSTLRISVYSQHFQASYPILIRTGLVCGVWKLTLWFDRADCFISLASFSFWNSWESIWCYRNFNSWTLLYNIMICHATVYFDLL